MSTRGEHQQSRQEHTDGVAGWGVGDQAANYARDSAKGVVAFYREALPEAGYEDRVRRRRGWRGEFGLRGHGVTGNISLAGNAVAVTIVE